MNKKFWKNCVVIAFILVFGLLSSILEMYGNAPELVKTADRPTQNITLPTEVVKMIDERWECVDEEEVINGALSITARYLTFSKHNNLQKGEANCVGYAQLCAAIMNELFRRNKLYDCSAKPVVGYATFYRLNLCRILERFAPKKWKNFFKNHDFVEFRIDNTPSHYYDPTIYDLMNCHCETVAR
ncbi:MAG: hypothetical protein IKN65_03205 [Clostridia bacterium]|nr:hypothetical protein [Clostridia bacterium]